jgi:type IV pilus assembly protein PilW
MPMMTSTTAMHHQYHIRPKSQQGFTLVELLVAMTLGLLVTLAAATALLVSRQGFFAVDAASQLRDNARYAQDIIQRIGVQAGYRNVYLMTGAGNASGLDANPAPSVYGINNSKRTTNSQAWDAGVAWASSDIGKNSDILILRAQTSTASETSTAADGSMIDCLGTAPTAVPTNRDDRFVSILHVKVGTDGEPSLMCSREVSGGGFEAQPLIQGVEDFQVLYGVDGVSPGVAPTATVDSAPDRYLRADQLTVTGNDVATYANWRRVRSLRIGMVLRSQPGSAVDTDSQTLYPLGAIKGSATGAIGSGYSNATNDPGSVFATPVDRRLRQVVTFTVHLRNFQDLETN